MNLIHNSSVPTGQLEHFFKKNWGSSLMVISSGSYQCDCLDGYSAVDHNGEILGCVTYVAGDHFEIISLDSVKENLGIGTGLLKAAEKTAENLGYQSIRLVTTNDNVHALKFYQKRNYRLIDLYLDAVSKARDIKPQIPEFADNGLPIKDEWLLKKELI